MKEEVWEMDLPDENDLFSDMRQKGAEHKVHQFINPTKVEEHIRFDPSDINNSLLRLSSMYAYYGILCAKARMQRDGMKNRCDLLRAKYDRAYRKKLQEEGEKVTEPRLKALIETNKEVVAADRNLIEAQAVMSSLEVVRDSIKIQRDALVQFNKNTQAERYSMSHGATSPEKSS